MPLHRPNYFRFDELRPVERLHSGIGVYDKTSFPGHYPIELVDVPDNPQILVTDQFLVQDSRTKTARNLGRQYLLTFHGQSTRSDWTQLSSPYRRMEDILEEIEREGIPVDAIAVCNPGWYKLPAVNGRSKYTYPRGSVDVGAPRKEDDIVIGTLWPEGDGKILIKGEPEYLGEITPEDVRRSITIRPEELRQ